MSYSLSFEPESITDLDKLRVGDYRVIYEFDRELQVIIIIRVGHRSEIY